MSSEKIFVPIDDVISNTCVCFLSITAFRIICIWHNLRLFRQFILLFFHGWNNFVNRFEVLILVFSLFFFEINKCYVLQSLAKKRISKPNNCFCFRTFDPYVILYIDPRVCVPPVFKSLMKITQRESNETWFMLFFDFVCFVILGFSK